MSSGDGDDSNEGDPMEVQESPTPTSIPESRFLRLPSEVRLKIYNYFMPIELEISEDWENDDHELNNDDDSDEDNSEDEGDVDNEDEGEEDDEEEDDDDDITIADDDKMEVVFEDEDNWDHTDHQLVTQARKNLMLVCHQITKEWAPLFFRSTTIVVDTLKHNIETVEDYEPYHGDPAKFVPLRWLSSSDFSSPRQFGETFLKTLAEYKLCNIRRLEYDASVWTDCAFGGRRSIKPYVNFKGIESLKKVLYRHRNGLESLCEVAVYALRNKYDQIFITLPPERADADSVSRAETIWSRLPASEMWDAVAEPQVQRGNPFDISRGWQAIRHLVVGKSLRMVVIDVADEDQPVFLTVERIQITWRKRKMGGLDENRPPNGPILRLTMHGRND